MARTTRNYETVGWQDGTVLQPAKVTVQGTEYEVTPQVESGTTPVNANNLRHMDNEIQRIVEEDIPSVLDVELIAVSDTAPIEFIEGDKYYNTEDKKIYTATSSAWENAETPEEGISYIVFETQTSYAWNGTDLISVGGGSGGTNNYPDLNNLPSINGVELVNNKSSSDLNIPNAQNVESNSTKDAYSCDYTNKRNTYSTDETFTGKYWVDGKKIYSKVVAVSTLTTGESNNINTGITNFNELISLTGVSHRTNGAYFSIPKAHYRDNNYAINLQISNDGSVIVCEVGSSLSSIDQTYFFVKYTKTND